MSKTDRELLELAARAAGLSHPDGWDWITNEQGFKWNPLTDDGDALRLAVKLGMTLHLPHEHSAFVGVGEPPHQTLERARPDPYAATRRAITRAAAEIGAQ